MAKIKNPPALNDNPNKIGVKDGIGYMFGDMGNMLVLAYVTTFIKVFYTDVLLIDASKLVTLFLVVKLWGAFVDPLWGLIIDSKKPKPDGKFRGYLKILCIPLSAAAVFCFVNIRELGITSDGIVLVYAYVSYTIFGTLYAAMDIPYGALASVITDDPGGRTLLSTFRSVGGGVGGAPITIILPLILYVNVEVNGEKVQAFSGTRVVLCGVAIAATAILAYLLCYKMTKERVKSPAVPQKTDIRVTYGSLVKSLPFISLTVASLFMSGMIEYQSLYQYLFKGYFLQPKLVSLQTISNYLPMAIMILFIGKLTKRFGKKELCSFGLGITVIASLLIVILRPGENQLWLFLALSFVNGFGFSFMSIVIWAMVTDMIDYQEFLNGRRDESSIYSVYSFSRKIGQTIACSGGMALLAWTEYNGANLIQAAGVGDKILTMCTVVPFVGYAIMFVLIAFAYPLNKIKLAQLHSELRERRAIAAQDNNLMPAEQ